ncbi:MAG: SsrA-binding protein SmpB [Planctomycetaceae bacterium]|nr:SsrA-binding protein SmpB [Planctomycetaceae bacterium]
MAKDKSQNATGPVATNKKARHNFELVEVVEAGMALLGTEVKSLRDKQCDLEGSYARLTDDEIWLVGAKIAPYERGGYVNHDPLRKRKLLLHKNQIRKIRTKLEQRGFTLVPIKIYFNERGKAKIELALATGKKLHDKRQAIQEKQAKRDISRDMKRYK